MPTDEERITAVEQKVTNLQKSTAAAIVEIEENTTILLGVIRRQGQDLRRISERLDGMDERLERVEQRLGRIETKFDDHTGLLNQILARLPQ